MEIQTSGSHVFTGPKFTSHKLDVDKIQTIEDVKDVLRGMDLTIRDDGSERFAPLRRFYRVSP